MYSATILVVHIKNTKMDDVEKPKNQRNWSQENVLVRYTDEKTKSSGHCKKNVVKKTDIFEQGEAVEEISETSHSLKLDNLEYVG